MLKKVTITGADDSVHPEDLVDLTARYPFVEWGILVSRNNLGIPRFPSLQWLKELTSKASGLALSCHLCGGLVRDFAVGINQAPSLLGDLWPLFKRVQLNFHGKKHDHSPGMFDEMLANPEKEFIFQFDEENEVLLKEGVQRGLNCTALFDRSHGQGLLPGTWPKPLDYTWCGYAGGLGPANIIEQVKAIEQAAWTHPFWIDMETQVRSNDDYTFDLEKVNECLMKCEALL